MSDDLFSVQGQIVLVSGASRGIGRGLAEGFARRGSTVIITGRENGTLEKTAKEEGVSVPEAFRRLAIRSARGDVRGASGTKRGA